MLRSALRRVRPSLDRGRRVYGRAGSDEGAGVLEYIGVATIVGLIVAALLVMPLGATLSGAVKQAICKLTNGSCGYDRPVPKCTTATRDRTVGAAATVFFVKGGHDDKYTIVEYGDGTAEVRLADSYQLGVSGTLGAKVDLAAIAKELKAKGYAEGSLSGTGGYQTVYTFPSHEAAEAWVDRNRGVLDHITNAVGGVTADALDQGLNWIKRKTGWGNQDDARAPDAVVVDLGAQATVGGGYGLSTLAGVSGDGKGVVNGSLKINSDGTQEFTGSFDVEGNANGALAFVTGKLGFTGSAQYVVSYDKDGNPTQLTIVGEYGGNGGIGTEKAGLPVSKGGNVSYGGKGDKGSKTNHSYTINLENPANRAAFEQAFVTAGPVALPRPTQHYITTGGVPIPDPVELASQLTPLIDRISKDAVYVRSEYDTDSMGGTIGAAGEGFGLEGTYKGSSSTLTSAQSQDFSVPSSRLTDMAGCTP